MIQKFIIKDTTHHMYFKCFESYDGVPDAVISTDKSETKIFDTFTEAKLWFKKIEEVLLKEHHINDCQFEIILVNMKNGINDFKEVMTWYSTSEE